MIVLFVDDAGKILAAAEIDLERDVVTHYDAAEPRKTGIRSRGFRSREDP